MSSESRHISTHISLPTDVVYGFASNPANLPRWAPGLCSSVYRVDGQWMAETGMGDVALTFAPENAFGVLDHDVTLASGETFHNPMRVIPHGSGCAVVFSLRRQPGTTDDDFDRDADAVLADLTRLKQLLEDA